ncbi:MAG TPA: hypothetical protein VJN18_18840 [Polyangiaceae bacterium]|nr:hypothetical protein [Polyangiaceae bacterium]
MIFTLEALNAEEGDALLLHYGKPSDPKLIVIDGGPPGVFKKTMLPRLESLRDSRAAVDPLPIRLLMVSHIDKDHVAGVLELVKRMAQADEDGEQPAFDVTTLWHNSFDDLVKKVKVADLDQLALQPKARGRLSPASLEVAGTVPMGRELRSAAEKLGFNFNRGFKELVVSPAKGKKSVALGEGLSFLVVGPRQAQLDALQNEWNAQIAKLKKAGKLKPAALSLVAAEFVDKSVSNLSSIVVLAQLGKKRMLLTGDARGDFVLEGLRASGLLKKKPLHLDIFKLPHHGSIRNAAAEMFESISADHYVVSANGKHGNPDADTLELLIDSRGQDAYTIHLTNRDPKSVKFLEKAKKGRKFKVIFRDPKQFSVKVELGEAMPD